MRAAVRATDGFQLLELLVKGVADAAPHQARDVLVELAILLPQGCGRHDRGRLDVPQVRDHLFEGDLPARGPLPSFWPAAHHLGTLRHFCADCQYFCNEEAWRPTPLGTTFVLQPHILRG